ncbi:MAG: sulfotransferase [Oceanicaulis sp.]|nr:sulfotransferase [Oceanicaulis sp.]
MTDPVARLQAAIQAENLLEMSRAARAMLATEVQLGADWAGVAGALLQAGDDFAALQAAGRLAEASPEHLEAWLWVAAVYTAMGDHANALKVFETQIKRFPEDVILRRRAGRALLELGRSAEAAAHFRQAVALSGGDEIAYEGLAQAHTFTPGDDVLAHMEQTRLNLPETALAEQRGVLAYAIAKAYEDVGEYDVSARRVTEGAAFYRETAPFDVENHEQAIAHLMKVYDPRFARSQDEAGLLDARPVFIVAPPAAGASWLARTLTAGEGVARLERYNSLFWMAASPLGDQRPEDIEHALSEAGDQSALAEVGRVYLRYAEERAGKAARIIDPSSLNEMSVGAAGLALPAARFIILTREPKDLAWAIFKRRFRKGRYWTYHLDDIARVTTQTHQLCERWRTLFADRILTVSYEALAADPGGEVKRIAEFAGVDAAAAASEAWLRADLFKTDPVGVHERAASRLPTVVAALERAGFSPD